MRLNVSKNLKIYLSILFLLGAIIGCSVMNPFRENETIQDTYNKTTQTLQLAESEEYTTLRDEMYQGIKNPTLQHSLINSAYPSKMIWVQVENGKWHISKFESINNN